MSCSAVCLFCVCLSCLVLSCLHAPPKSHHHLDWLPSLASSTHISTYFTLRGQDRGEPTPVSTCKDFAPICRATEEGDLHRTVTHHHHQGDPTVAANPHTTTHPMPMTTTHHTHTHVHALFLIPLHPTCNTTVLFGGSPKPCVDDRLIYGRLPLPEPHLSPSPSPSSLETPLFPPLIVQHLSLLL